MNLTTIVGKTGMNVKMLCLAGMLSFPVVSLQASDISLTEYGGGNGFESRGLYYQAGI